MAKGRTWQTPKMEKLKRQRLGIFAVAPRFSERAGRFVCTEQTKAIYLQPKAAPANIEGKHIQRLDPQTLKSPKPRTHGDFKPIRSLLTPDVYNTKSVLIPARKNKAA